MRAVLLVGCLAASASCSALVGIEDYVEVDSMTGAAGSTGGCPDVPGDCKRAVGSSCTVEADPADVYDDSNECTQDACTPLGPVNEPLDGPQGTCLCTDTGACVECLVNADCPGTICTDAPAYQCAGGGCFDMTTNNGESYVDCGGPCAPCTDLSTCATNSDCLSGVCVARVCRVPTCDDGVKNGAETDVDCGVACPRQKCAAYQACSAHGDCAGGYCTGAICMPTCTDGAKNNGEEGLDCGGPYCPACS